MEVQEGLSTVTTRGKADFIGNYLGNLGPTPTDIANECTRLGAQGTMVSAHHCALASLIELKFGVHTILSPFGGRIAKMGHDGEFRIPPVVAEFIKRFDRGEFPQLVGAYAGDPFGGRPND